MNGGRRWLWLLLAALALAWWLHHGRPVKHAPGVLVPEAPAQAAIRTAPTQLGKGNVAIKPLATFSLSARVLGREDYRWDREAELVPTDLALGWGRMSDSAVLDKIAISPSVITRPSMSF